MNKFLQLLDAIRDCSNRAQLLRIDAQDIPAAIAAGEITDAQRLQLDRAVEKKIHFLL